MNYRYPYKRLNGLTEPVLLLRIFSTTASTTNSCTEQLWAHQFPLLLQKSLCKTSRNEPSQLTNEHYHIPLWLSYIDDTSTAVHKDEIDDFHEHLHGQNADIRFTKEIEENGKIPFLVCLVTRDNNELRTTIYRKPTHTDRLLDQSSYNPTSHKATAIRTLTRRVQLVCDSPDSLTHEIKYLDNAFNKNNYNRDFIRHNTYRNSEPNATNPNATPVTTATIPYIKGTSESIAQILQPYNIRVAHKPISLLYDSY